MTAANNPGCTFFASSPREQQGAINPPAFARSPLNSLLRITYKPAT